MMKDNIILTYLVDFRVHYISNIF